MAQASRGWLLLLLLWPLSGCSPLGLLNTVVSDTSYVLNANRAYGSHPRQMLDIYTPQNGRGEPAKTLIFFYGGRWQRGEKEDYRFVAEALTAQGFVVVVPDYRLYPDVQFPAFVEDAAAAVRWVQGNIDRYRGDPAQLYLVGHSSGAHIAALLHLDERYLGRGVLRGTVGLAGPYDFLPFDVDIAPIFAAVDPRTTQPINFVEGNEPPLLLLSGTDDTTVNAGNTLRLAARVRELGGSAQVILYQDVSHAAIVGALASPLQDWAPTLRDITTFIKAR